MSAMGEERSLASARLNRYGFTMAVVTARLTEMIEAEIALVDDEPIRARIRALLLEPQEIECRWDYWVWDKEKFQETYPCWAVLADTWPSGKRIGIVFCEHGFGPLSPWGLIRIDEEKPSMGQDSGWFRTFREAAADVLDIPVERVMA